MFYLDLFRALQQEQVEYVVVGGLALVFHDVERTTMDVDLVLAMNNQNLGRFLKVANELKLAPTLPVPITSLCNADQIETWIREKHLIAFSLHSTSNTLPTVDIIVKPKVPFEKMYHDRIEKDLSGVRVSFACIDDLIELKTGTGRPIDASDIKALGVARRAMAGKTHGEN